MQGGSAWLTVTAQRRHCQFVVIQSLISSAYLHQFYHLSGRRLICFSSNLHVTGLSSWRITIMIHSCLVCVCVGKSFCASPPSSFLSGHAVVQFQSATLFLVEECKIMQRTCDSIANLKIEHKQRTKCCNLQHFALSAGKNPRKYHSFSPRMWLKHCYLQGFVHVTIFDFLGNA